MPNMNTYDEALAVLKGRKRRRLHNNTYLEQEDGAIYVRCYDTDVICFQPNMPVVIKHGGYLTNFTADTITSFGPTGLRVEKRHRRPCPLTVEWKGQTYDWTNLTRSLTLTDTGIKTD